jgi:DNA-binding CsgD family transcriptional regulator
VDAAILDRVLTDTHARVLDLEPLSDAGIDRWLAVAYGSAPAQAFVDECRIATGGNPFLIQEVIASLRAEGFASDEHAASLLGGIAPASVAHSVLTRLAPLGAEAVILAEAAAVLSTDGRLERVAAIAGLSVDRATELADRLTAAGILAGGEPLLFRHPVLRSAVYDQTPSAWRALAHLTAAERLLADGGGPERAASHLLLAPEGGRAWVVDALRAAAAATVTRGAPDSAVRLLRRAVQESPPGDVELLLELAAAEATIQDPAAAEHAELARTLAATAEQRSKAALVSARALMHLLRATEAMEVAAAAAPDAPDAATRHALEAHATMAHVWQRGLAELGGRLRRLDVDELAGETAGERLLITIRVMERTAGGGEMAQILSLAGRVLSHRPLELAEHEETLPILGRCLALCDALDAAGQVLDDLIERSRAAGAVVAVAIGVGMRAECRVRAGTLADAEVDARESIDIAREHDAPLWYGSAVAILATVLLEREPPAAVLEMMAAHGYGGVELPPAYQGSQILLARGRARAALGDHRGAVPELRSCGERQLRWGEVGAAGLAWRPHLALSLAALGEEAEAWDLAQEQLRLSRAFGAPGILGSSLRVCALLRHGEEQLAGLRDAELVLAASPARLEHARVLLDLGSALRRSGCRIEARETLARALDETSRCGARNLAERTREELRAAGARPRRERLSGPASLTASERRVAELAATGLTNRQIAQSLFVTTKTVEMHLGRAYAKLDIEGRDGLAGALDAP